MTGAGGLLPRIADLERADGAIAEAARRHHPGALVAAIEAREPAAAALLAAIAEDDRRQQARLAAANRGRDASELLAWLADRDLVMETLARTVDARTREYHRILREIAASRPGQRDGVRGGRKKR
jgi:hypothetical protein